LNECTSATCRQASTTDGDGALISRPKLITSASDVTGRPSAVSGCELAKSWRFVSVGTS
jgi:hypothetical protein